MFKKAASFVAISATALTLVGCSTDAPPEPDMNAPTERTAVVIQEVGDVKKGFGDHATPVTEGQEYDNFRLSLAQLQRVMTNGYACVSQTVVLAPDSTVDPSEHFVECDANIAFRLKPEQ